MKSKSFMDLVEYAPEKVLMQILLKIDPRELSNVCSTNSKVAKVCRDLRFRNAYNKKYPEYEINVNRSYTEKKRVGSGAEGDVYVVKKGSPKQDYAMKVIRARGERHLKSVWVSLKNHALLNHPNIVKYIRTTGPNKKGYLRVYMEKCDMDLSQYSKEKLIDEEEALDIIRQAAEGLKYLHEKGYIHRDIKDENIMLCSGAWKLIDFGFLEKIEYPHESIGTLDFMAPEVILESLGYDEKKKYEDFEIGTASDVWSLGITLYELYFGEVPFVRRLINYKSTFKAILEDPLIFPEKRYASPKLKTLLEGMLTKNPKERWTIDHILDYIKS